MSKEEALGGHDLDTHYAMTLSVTLAIGVTSILMGMVAIFLFGLDTEGKFITFGICSIIYLLDGLIFYFSSPTCNCKAVW